MRRTPITIKKEDFPVPFWHYLQNTAVYDSSCSPEARVWYLETGEGLYLKAAPKGALKREAEMVRYFCEKGLGAEVLEYCSLEKDWLLTARVAGEDCTHAVYLAQPERLCDLLAEQLRRLHEETYGSCLVQDRMAEYFQTVRENYQKGVFDPSFLSPRLQGLPADEVYRLVEESRHRFASDTLLHGDYCLPNVMLNDWRFSGFIDLGNGGVGDRHVDLFWGVWTLQFNLKTPRYGSRFLDAYGRDAVDAELLDIVGAAECFG